MKFDQIQYKRPDFDQDLQSLNQYLDTLENAENSEEFFDAHKKYEDKMAQFAEMYTIAYIRNSIDTRDEFYEKEVEAFDQIIPKFSQVGNRLQNIRLTSKFRKEFEDRYGSNIT